MDKNQAKVTVVVLPFSSDENRKRALDCLQEQTLEDVQILCVKDPISGVSALADILEEASGGYIYLLQEHYYPENDMLEKCFLRTEKDNADLVLFSGKKYNRKKDDFDTAEEYLAEKLIKALPRPFSRRDVPDRLFSLSSPDTKTKFFRKDLLQKLLQDHEGIGGLSLTVSFPSAVMALAERISAVEEPLVRYRMIPGTGSLNDRISASERIGLLEDLYDFLWEEGLFVELEKAFVSFALTEIGKAINASFGRTEHMEAFDRLEQVFLPRTMLADYPSSFYSKENAKDLSLLKAIPYIRAVEKHETGRVKEIRDAVVVPCRSKTAPVVSVIVPVYNMEPFLEECLDSLIGQTFRDIEILCIEDDSTDASLSILLRYAERDDRIAVIQEENAGLSAARNTGVRHARGKYLYFIDSDDLLDTEALETLVERADRDGLDLLEFDAESFLSDDSGEKFFADYRSNYIRKYSYPGVWTGPQLMAKMRQTDEYRTPVWQYFIRRDLVEKHQIRFLQGILHEDNAYTFRLFLNAERAGHLGRPFYKRRIRAESIMTKPQTFKNVLGYFFSYLDMEETARRADLDEEESAAAGSLVSSMLRLGRSIYRKLSEEEKRFDLALPDLDRAAFQALIADEENRIARLERERDGLKKGMSADQKKIKQLETSHAYRIGRVVTWPVRKSKELKKRAGQEQKKAGPSGKSPAQAWLLGGIDHGNLGDHQIAESMKEFLWDIRPDLLIREIPMKEYYEKKQFLIQNIRQEDILLFCGGGNLGTLWPRLEKIRRDAFTSWPENRKIVFPQSVFFEDSETGKKELQISSRIYSDDKAIMALRDRTSFALAEANFSCKLFLTPDIVLYSHVQNPGTERDGCLLLLRNDKERSLSSEEDARIRKTAEQFFATVCSADTLLDHPVKEETRNIELKKLFDQIASSSLVITDRLHGMIFSAISGTPCIVFSNNYHKIRAALQWVEDLPYIYYLEDPGQLSDLLRRIDVYSSYEYPCAEMQQKFAGFRDAVLHTLEGNTDR